MGDVSSKSVKSANLSDLEVHYQFFSLRIALILSTHFLARFRSGRFPRGLPVKVLSIRTSFFFYADYLFYSTRYICM
jgi:hypothetical protein